MPARNSSMDLSSPEAEPTQGATRRKSGRVVKKPDNIAAASSKRKRNAAETEDVDIGDDASEESEESDDDEADEEEVKERRKRARNQKKTNNTKPAAKKAKAANGEPVRLAIRPNPTKKSRAKPRPQNLADAEAAGGLYGECRALHNTRRTC
jgi:cohesin complex subunit SA-1/2